MTVRFCGLVAICVISLGGGAEARDFLGELTRDCNNGEIVVWGKNDDVSLFRGQNKDFLIGRGESVVWFCGRSRRNFDCPSSDKAEWLDVRWDQSGQVTLTCYE